MLECIECGARAPSFELGWSAIRVEDPDGASEPEVVIYCASCLAREFGGLLLWLTDARVRQTAD
jgi:hypothetical protein